MSIRATHTRFEKGVSLEGVGGVIHIYDYLFISACDYEKNKKVISAINTLTWNIASITLTALKSQRQHINIFPEVL